MTDKGDEIMADTREFLNCGLKGTALAYLDILRRGGLSEKGKDHFINVLLDECQRKIEVVPKKELEDVIEQIRAMRDELYDKLPTGDIAAFELIKIIKEHIQNIDDAFGAK
jgi:hypothetical protein